MKQKQKQNDIKLKKIEIKQTEMNVMMKKIEMKIEKEAD